MCNLDSLDRDGGICGGGGGGGGNIYLGRYRFTSNKPNDDIDNGKQNDKQ